MSKMMQKVRLGFVSDGLTMPNLGSDHITSNLLQKQMKNHHHALVVRGMWS